MHKHQAITLFLNNITGKRTNRSRFYPTLFCLSILFFSSPSFSFDREEMEAVFLGVVSKHITWPADAIMQNKSNFFNICIFGDDTFGGHLKLYDNKQIKNKPVKILYPQKIGNFSNCHLIYISQSKRKELSKLLEFIDNKSILTVSLIRGFVEKNGMFQFYENGSQLDIKINYRVTLNHGFDIKASLLKYSKVVNR